MMVAHVQVHDLMGKENRDLVTIGHRDSTYPRRPMLDKVSVLTRDSLSLYYCPGFKRCTVRNLNFFEYDNVSCLADSKCTLGNEQHLDFKPLLGILPPALLVG